MNCPIQLTVILPDVTAQRLERICKAKSISLEEGTRIMLYFSCRLLEDGGLKESTDLLDDLDFGKAERQQVDLRANQLLAQAETVILDAQALHRGLRGRLISVSP